MAEPVDLVLFDLGGVLIEVAGVRAMLELTGMASEEELWRRWLTCRWVRRFESGGCSETEFAAGVVADWQPASALSKPLCSAPPRNCQTALPGPAPSRPR